MKGTVFILRIIETLLMVAGFSFTITLWFMPEKGPILVQSLMIAYAISLIANALQRTSGSILLLVASFVLISAGVAQETGYLPLAWELSQLVPDTTINVILYPAILLAIVDWLSFTTIHEISAANKHAISADERVAMMLQANTRKDK